MEQNQELKQDASGLLEAIQDEVATLYTGFGWRAMWKLNSVSFKDLKRVSVEVARRYAAAHALAVGEAVARKAPLLSHEQDELIAAIPDIINSLNK